MKKPGQDGLTCKRNIWSTLKEQKYLQAFTLLGIVFLIIFAYIPMVGIIIAFKDYKITSGFSGFFTSKWVGFKYFIEFYNDVYFWPIIRNTLVLSLLKLVFTFPAPIIFALILNELRNEKIKKVVQTVSYLPHFISWVVVAGLLFAFLNQQTGLINQMLISLKLVDEPISFLADPKYFWPICVISDVWKEMGWWTIIFLAAIVGIDQEIYQASIVDGAGRLQRIWYITLPSIKETIIVVLILSLGSLLGGGLGGSNFEQAYLLGNTVNYDVSNILQTYTMTVGLTKGRYSYAAAMGLIQSVISLILVYSSNYLSKKISGSGLF